MPPMSVRPQSSVLRQDSLLFTSCHPSLRIAIRDSDRASVGPKDARAGEQARKEREENEENGD